MVGRIACLIYGSMKLVWITEYMLSG